MAARRLLALSPHLDDAVLACGALLAAAPGAVLLTVFAGRPPLGTPLTGWDRDCGFAPGDDVIGRRRDEDSRAARVLGANPAWLDFLDDQYGAPPSVDAIAHAVHAVLDRHDAERVLFPLGLFHADHRRASDATLALVRADSGRTWIAYEDALYRTLTGAVDERVAALRQSGYALERMHRDATPREEAAKREAVACYRSQLRGLATPGRLGHLAAFEPERYWRVRGAGAGA